MPRYKMALIILLLLFPLCLFSQSKVIRDLRFRTSVKAEKEIVNDLDAFIESEIVMESLPDIEAERLYIDNFITRRIEFLDRYFNDL